MELQVYYDRASRENKEFASDIDTFDIDFQQGLLMGDRHSFLWGLGNRTISDNYDARFPRAISPPNLVYTNWSAFAQDEIAFPEHDINLTLGSKFEINHFTGFQVQPNVRVSWKPAKEQTVWASVSRAVRTPSRIGDGGFIRMGVTESPGNTPIVTTLYGNRGFEAEVLWAYELGYRIKPADSLTLDFASFYNVFSGIRDIYTGSLFAEDSPTTHRVLPVFTGNIIDAELHGLEATASWQALEFWRLDSAFTWLHVNAFPNTGNFEENDPQYQVNFRSRINLPYHLEFDTAVYFVDKLRNQNIPEYTRLDLRLGWHPVKDLELSMNFFNLQDPQHFEFLRGKDLVQAAPTQIQRSFYGKITWRF